MLQTEYINREKGRIITLSCDDMECNNKLFFLNKDLSMALKEIRSKGWGVFLIKGEWTHICDRCMSNNFKEDGNK